MATATPWAWCGHCLNAAPSALRLASSSMGAARAVHEVGVGKTLNFALGGKSRIPGDSPLELPWTVEAVHDGNLAATGPFYRGMKMRLGPSPGLRYRGVRIVVATLAARSLRIRRCIAVGIEPTEQAILVNKSSVHFERTSRRLLRRFWWPRHPARMAADPTCRGSICGVAFGCKSVWPIIRLNAPV